MADDFVKKVMEVNPFPWRQEVFPNGIVRLVDSTGKEVPLFTVTEFSCFITNVMSRQKEKEAA